MANQPEVYPEDRELVEKLAKLQSMHQQISDLRGLLPDRLLRPTRMALENPKTVSPEILASDLRKAAAEGSRDIKQFKRDYNHAEMRELFQQSNTAEFPQGRDFWAVDYLALVKGIKPSTVIVANTKVEKVTSGNISPPVDVEAVLKMYEGSRSAVTVNRASPNNIFPLTVIVDAMSFTITEAETNGKASWKLDVTPESRDSTMRDQIRDFINDTDANQDLKILLEMLASYHQFKFKSCDKCRNIFDVNMNYPLVRQRKSPTGQENLSVEWQILHTGCTK